MLYICVYLYYISISTSISFCLYIYIYSYCLRSRNNTHKLCNLPRQDKNKTLWPFLWMRCLKARQSHYEGIIYFLPEISGTH